ncbi:MULTISPECIES: LPXTG cell wall anchor domain-containing protein, partial [unclassified Mammaliicoccus]
NNQDHKASHNKQLPDTGEESEVNTTLIGGLLAGLGSLFLFGRRRKEDK